MHRSSDEQNVGEAFDLDSAFDAEIRTRAGRQRAVEADVYRHGSVLHCWIDAGDVTLDHAVMRIHLGRLWSGTITLKQDHRIIDSGPYGLVRHPIYTGLILSILATAAAQKSIERFRAGEQSEGGDGVTVAFVRS